MWLLISFIVFVAVIWISLSLLLMFRKDVYDKIARASNGNRRRGYPSNPHRAAQRAIIRTQLRKTHRRKK